MPDFVSPTQARKSALKGGAVQSPPSGGLRPPAKAARLEDGGMDTSHDTEPDVQVDFAPEVPAFPVSHFVASTSASSGQNPLLAQQLAGSLPGPVPVSAAASEPPTEQDTAEDPTMKDLFRAMQNMNAKMDSSFRSMESNLGGRIDNLHQLFVNLQTDVASMKAEMTTKIQFSALEVRVEALETKGLPSPQINHLQQQLQRLDPANKSLCFRGFKEGQIQCRKVLIEECLARAGVTDQIINIEHLFSKKDDQGNRKILPISIVELPNRNVREAALKKIIDSKTTDENGGEIQVARAKTSVQRERNAALKQACAKLKTDSRNIGKEISIEWLIDGTKNRTVNINKQVVFLQTLQNTIGTFQSPFQNLSV
jgi:hypothetical protein